LAIFTLTKAFNTLPAQDKQKGLSILLLMVIVYIYKGIISLNAQTTSKCVFIPQFTLLIHPWVSSKTRMSFPYFSLTSIL
jgi:hypothetical protein